MAGEDTQMLANGNVEALTIIPPKMANGNGLICGKQQHNNNGSIPNGKLHEITAAENGKLIMSDEKSSSLHTEFDDADVSCGWGPCRPHWLNISPRSRPSLSLSASPGLVWVSFSSRSRSNLISREKINVVAE